MDVQAFLLNITSAQPEVPRDFYRDVVGLPVAVEISDSTFRVGGSFLAIDSHSEATGPTREPWRFLIDLFVADLMVEQRRLEALDVPFIRSAGREGHGAVISTFLDPDGNYCQLVELGR